jgi:alpha-methylacyl-CoA racemase
MVGVMELGLGTGPLRGVKVVELAGIGPSPHACMTLADLGADVIRIDRPGGPALNFGAPEKDFLNRGRPNVALNLKDPAAVETVLQLIESADILIEGLRPGVTERLGLGPDDCLARNPKLVYGRMTGWGQDGPWAQAAGHDMNYIAITGALFGLGQDPARPHFPSNLLGDFGGGSSYLVIGVLAALLESRLSGKGQVVDAAIVDGTAHLNAMGSSMLAAGVQREVRAQGTLDGGMPFYDIFETADARHLSVGCLEPQFFNEFVRLLGLADTAPGQFEFGRYDEMRELFAATIKGQPLAHWETVFAGTDACAAPILTQSEAVEHDHIKARGIFVERNGSVEPAPAPRFSGTPSTLSTPAVAAGASTREALAAWGVEDVDALIESGAAVQA